MTDKQKLAPTAEQNATAAADYDNWLEPVYSAVSRFLHEEDPDRGISELLEEMRLHLEADSVHICETDVTGVCLECSFASLGNCVNHPTRPTCRCLYPLLIQGLRAGNPLWIDVEPPDTSFDQHLYSHLRSHGISQMLAIPLLSKAGLRGFLGVDFARPTKHNSPQMLAAMSTLSRLLSICLELRRRETEAEARRNDLNALFGYMPLGYLRIKLIRNEQGKAYDFYITEANQKLAELTAEPLEHFLHQRGSNASSCYQHDLLTLEKVLNDGCYRTINHTFDRSGRLCHIVFYSSRADEVVGLFLDMTEVDRMRQALNRSEGMLKNVFENMTAGVEIYDTEGRLININPKDMELFGISSKKDVLGINLFENPNISERIRQQIRQEESVDFYTNYSFQKIGGYYSSTSQKNIHLYTRASKIYDARQRFLGYIVISMDNTEQMDAMKRVDDFEHFFLLISTYAKVGYAKYNLLTREGYAISQWFKNLGEAPDRPLAEVAGIYEQMHPDDREQILKFLELVKQGEATSFNHEVRIRRQADEEQIAQTWNWVHVHVVVNSYHPEQELIELICVNYDITELKETEQKLIEAKEKAETADRLKSAFLANMSHEIRTPLNAIVGFSSLLSEAQNDEERQQYVEIIQENNNLLLQLISDILDISKIEAGTLEFSLKQMDGAKLCNEVVENLKGRTQPGVELICDAEGCDYQLSSDPYRLRQVLFNFVNNAIKFTSQGAIHIGCTPIDERHLRFYVSDTGIGISRENCSRIFERFVKVNTFVQGTGLGLPICKSIIHQLGGEIGVESTPGEGSTFWFTLPIDSITNPS